MRIFLENEGDLELALNYLELAEEVAEAVLDYENCPYESQVELLLTDNEEIRRINQEFREIDRPTDVLSFPMVDFGSPAEYDFLEEECVNFCGCIGCFIRLGKHSSPEKVCPFFSCALKMSKNAFLSPQEKIFGNQEKNTEEHVVFS